MTELSWKQLRRNLKNRDADSRARAEELLKREFDQAWAHYRQLEASRTQHLGFFFAATFALAPILKVIVDLRVLGDHRLLVGVAVAGVHTALALFVLLVVRRSNAVLVHYEGVVVHVRSVFYGDLYDDASDLLDVRRNSVVRGVSFSISRAAEAICAAVVILLPLVTVLVSLALVTEPQLGWPKYLALVLAVAVLGAATSVLFQARWLRRSGHAT